MSDSPVEDLRKEIQAGRVLVVVGTGVSLAATGGKPDDSVASWRGLLKEGLNRCQTLKGMPGDRADRIRADIASDVLEDILSAASKIRSSLGSPDSSEVKTWLRETVGSLKQRTALFWKRSATSACPLPRPTTTTFWRRSQASLTP